MGLDGGPYVLLKISIIVIIVHSDKLMIDMQFKHVISTAGKSESTFLYSSLVCLYHKPGKIVMLQLSCFGKCRRFSGGSDYGFRQ